MRAESSGPVVLCILDGWGIGIDSPDNAIFNARTPVWDKLLLDYPSGELVTSGAAVGLPDGQMGNSEVGHMNIGAGRVAMQDLPRINQSINQSALEQNSKLQEYILTLKENGGTCHLLGLLSPGGVHSHQEHILELCRILNSSSIPVAIHIFLDGRDTMPRSAAEYLKKFETDIGELKTVRIATVSGRYWSMDRDNRWDRIFKSWAVIVRGSSIGLTYSGASEIISNAYESEISDEFIDPAVVKGYEGIKDGDGLLMANFRADRVRQLLSSFIDPDFSKFDREILSRFSSVLGMCSYSKNLDRFMETIFPPVQFNNVLGQVIASSGLRQLRIAETEKYAHVTFFLNGGEERIFDGEERILVPSPKVSTYDTQPEMSALEVTDRLIDSIKTNSFDFAVVNFANPDMIGHTGNFDAACKSVETVDLCLGRLLSLVHEQKIAILVTSDHGNVEQMKSASGSAHTAHTLNPVPYIIISDSLDRTKRLPNGILADIAPTILDLLGLDKPKEMTGKSLLD